jgi:histidinol-phosphate aminotransferase
VTSSEVSDGARFVRRSLDEIPPAEPTPRIPRDIVSLGLNEGLSGPFPAALEAISAELPALNRYPARGSGELTAALAERQGVPTSQLLVAAGADALIGYACQAVLEPGDEVVIPWPSFPSFVRDAQKRAAKPVAVPLVEGQVEVEALRSAVTAKTRLLFLATPNNPTGLPVARSDVIELVLSLPEHVLPVVDEAYFDFLEPGERLDTIADLVKTGQDVLALRTFSKLYGLAGLRVGYGVGPAAVVAAMRKVQRGYDVGTLAQVAALASLDDEDEVLRRRAANRAAVAALVEVLSARGLEALEGSATNFVLVDVGADADDAALALLEHGVAVQSGTPFGAPTSLRIGACPPDDLARLDAALGRTGLRARRTAGVKQP